MISHRNVIANVLQICASDSVARDQIGLQTQTTLGVLPFSHIYGLVLVGLVGHFRGDQVVVLPKFDLTSVLAAVQNYRIEQLSVVPPMLIQMISNREKCDKYDLSSVRWVFSGAAPLGSEVIDDLLKRYPSWRIGQGYGKSFHLRLSIHGMSSVANMCQHRHDGSVALYPQHYRDRHAVRLIRATRSGLYCQDH